MKKILSMLLVLLLFCIWMLSGLTASASAEEFSITAQNSLSATTKEDTKYFSIQIKNSVEIYELSYWVKVNGLLEDVRDYTVEYGEEIEQMYLDYVAEKRAEIQAENLRFFEDNFDASVDELIYNSKNRGFVMVKSTPSAIAKLAESDVSYSVVGSHSTLEGAEAFYEDNDYNEYYPEEPYLDPYELVYVIDFYKETEEPRYAFDTVYGYVYLHMYDHYADNVSTADEATPDYVLAFAGENICSPAFSAGGFGDKYLLQEYNIYYPYTLGYHIITTEDMKIWTLREAWEAQLEGVEDVFEEYGLGVKRGDSNFDGEINVRDATYIQKCLAGIESFTDDEYVGGFSESGQGEDGYFSDRVSDMNMDDEVNIKDATAIQKFVAGLGF